MRAEAFAPIQSDDAAALLTPLQAVDDPYALMLPYVASEKRAGVLAILGLAHEVARIRQVVTEPMLEALRRRWWAELIEGFGADAPRREHPLARALTQCFGATSADFRKYLTAIPDSEDADGLDRARAHALASWIDAEAAISAHDDIVKQLSTDERGSALPAALAPLGAALSLRRALQAGKGWGPFRRRAHVFWRVLRS